MPSDIKNKTKKIKILIFPGEAENAFELFQALRFATRFEVWGASSLPGYGNLLFPRYRDNLPNISDDSFLLVFNEFLRENDISMIFPTHDDVALYLAENKDNLAGKLVGSDEKCARFCREKKLLYAAIAHEPFCPTTYTDLKEVDAWPVFIKPNKGQGGVGGSRADNPEVLERLWRLTADPVVCEFLPGEELTVDCFSDRHGKLLFVGPRSRNVIKMGVAFVSRPVPLDDVIQTMAESLHTKFSPRGLWFFQTKRDEKGCPKLMEISCRAAGTMSVYRQLGVNLPLLAAYDALGMDVSILKNNFQLIMRRRLHSSYAMDYHFKTVYVDYDDTIIVDGRVNSLLVQFLYECRNQNKRLILLTKHVGNLKSHMKKFCIPSELFDEIIHCKENCSKSDFVTDKEAILIDNLFTERSEVLERTGIPVFDVDAVEGLLQ